MYLISNKERRDILNVLTAIKKLPTAGGDTRIANIVRLAGLLTRRLEKKKVVNNSLIKKTLTDEIAKK